ncbi:hypothetical protein EJ08DRAFT_644779 [Tothia fuscella]|uniref:Uncharacterized protein n=1 Tax=Tothia fuscella TaxID=1048955 RepID=A0A9P4P2X7_9PEZI|nr:hypothetical protein EJ08DRAFT_644779 [Tothia fuscella]
MDHSNQGQPSVPAHRNQRQTPSPPGQPLSAYALPRARSDESWVEVSSQPSSSSLSSVADEIITDGLRVQYDSNARRRRIQRRSTMDNRHVAPRNFNRGGSSQEEYEESESESDRVMTSSNEALQRSPLGEEWRPPASRFTASSASSGDAHASGNEGDDDENATAVGVSRGNPCFTPQPNAFTQQSTTRPQQDNSSYFPQRPARPAPHRHSYAGREEHSPYNMISPSYQADHDAALRASLSTLLSCAAAARGLPKSGKAGTELQTRGGPSNRINATSIGMVPESAVFGSSNVRPTQAGQSPGSSPSIGPDAADKSKRKATTGSTTPPRSSSKDRRAAKKVKRTSSNWTPATMEEVSPTLLTWVVSAGVVVLVSAISFSAGYVVGKEAGHVEALAGMGADVSDTGRACGRDAIKGAGRGLQRLRLADAASSIRV